MAWQIGRRRAATWFGSLLVMSLIAGCGLVGESQEEALAELRSRPLLEEWIVQTRTMAEEIRATVSKRVPGLVWTRDVAAEEERFSFCEAPFTKIPKTDSGVRQGGMSDRPIPDEVWAQVRTDVGAVVARYGYTAPAPVIDQPGKHSVIYSGKWGSYIRFGSIKASSFVIFGPCLLRSSETTPQVTRT